MKKNTKNGKRKKLKNWDRRTKKRRKENWEKQKLKDDKKERRKRYEVRDGKRKTVSCQLFSFFGTSTPLWVFNAEI